MLSRIPTRSHLPFVKQTSSRSRLHRRFRRPLGAETLEPRHLLAAQPIITEFVADNASEFVDNDGDSSDWIELYNAGDAAIDLNGWHLTDEADEPSKWTFPSVTLERGEYLVVFASGKDRQDPDGELHTSFQLDAGGEYVALTRPDGTSASAYGTDTTDFPKQQEDVSYGISIESVEHTLVDSNAAYETFVPTTANGGSTLGASWTGGSEPFDSSSWTTRDAGIGYDLGGGNAGTFAILDAFESANPGSLQGQNGWNASSGVQVVSDPDNGTNQVIALTGDNQVAFKPISIGNLVHRSAIFFRMRRDGPTSFSAGTTDVASPSSDPANFETEINIQDGSGTSTGVDQLNVRDRDVYKTVDTWEEGTWYNVWMLVSNLSNTYQIYMQGGSLTTPTLLDIDGVNRWVFRNGPSTNALNRFLLQTGSNHTGTTYIDDIYIDTTQENLTIPVDIDYAGYISPTGNVESAMQGVNSGLLARTTFELSDPGAFYAMSLDMQYDDGFVAYLNGVEVARRNAPGVAGTAVAWNATATAEQPSAFAISPEAIDISDSLHALVAGTNVLAIHALNTTSSDNDFLLIPKLASLSLSDNFTERFFLNPTPGSLNDDATSLEGFVNDTQFTGDAATFHDRGLYTEPFDVTLTTATPGATIVYTTDGSQPTLDNGTAVEAMDALTPPSATLHIDSTTNLRVAAFKDDYGPTNVDTQSYIFPSQVVSQNGNGLPTSWGAAPAVDYEMDPDIYNDPVYGPQLADSLLSLPTVSMTIDVADMWGPNGIYSNTLAHADIWERSASIELIYPDGSEGFQINAGVQIQGGASREVLKSPKHSFRVLFKEQWGPSKLNFPVFGDDAAGSFDALLLRAGFNNTWVHWDSTQRRHGDYVRDSWGNATQRAMGHLSKHDTFVHLYINGLYWGMYDMAERPEESFASTYLGGEKEDYDVINNTVTVINGTVTAWNEMMAIANAGVADNASYQAIKGYLDIDNFIDYMIMNYYGANTDWDDHNWYAARHSRIDGQTVDNAAGDPDFAFKFFNFDGEHLIELTTDNATGINNANRPTRLHNQLMGNAEYRLKFADHVQELFAEGGVLSPEVAAARYAEIANQIELAIVAESARWGDYRRDVHPYSNAPYEFYTPEFWTTEQTRLQEEYFPVRTDAALNQFIARGWFPNVDVPDFAIDGTANMGGEVAPGAALTLSGADGAIYYTLDVSDPRLPAEVQESIILDEFAAASALLPSSADDAVDGNGTPWYSPGFVESAAWRSGTTGVGYERTVADYAGLINLNFPEMDGGNTSLFVRVPFTIADASSLASINTLTLNMKYDDGFQAYLNGIPVASANAPATVAWDSLATAGHSDAAAVIFESFAIDLEAFRSAGGELVVGQNLLAIQGLNDSTTSSDLLVLPQISAGQVVGAEGLSE
ncbi:MAG: CotH kinase family protein, partial [Planctomycetales bacterium]|nr:CotH kinase family protein [Planctomycetales bacterium]